MIANPGPRATYWSRMKRGLICSAAIALCTLAPRASDAKCEASHDSVFPATASVLPTNGRIVLTRHGLLLDSPIAEMRPLELRAETERVPLRVAETNMGVKNVQYVLVPARVLQPNTRYTLRIQTDDGSEGPSLRDGSEFAWTTGSAADSTPPRWRARPRVGGSLNQRYGCGPAIYVNVTAPVDGALVRVELRATDGGQTSRYLMRPFDDVIDVGHQMCGGAFDLAPNRRYVVSLTAVNAAGNETPAPGRRLEIVGPAPKVAERR